GFSITGEAKVTESASYGNGADDEIGVQVGAVPPAGDPAASGQPTGGIPPASRMQPAGGTQPAGGILPAGGSGPEEAGLDGGRSPRPSALVAAHARRVAKMNAPTPDDLTVLVPEDLVGD